MTHPYDSQPQRAFWRRTIGDKAPDEIGEWYTKRFPLDGKRIATAGSCFAQHIGRQLRSTGFAYLDLEPPPAGLPEAEHADWGYRLYSARYGNVYTARQFRQLIERAEGRFTPAEAAWEKDGGVVDPFRPTIEPEPFGSVAELDAIRRDHLEAVAQMLRQTDVMVFTLGLTESWLSRHDGACFPLCPGTAGGQFDPAQHQFHNLTSAEVRADLEAALAALRAINPAMELLLTVSPVPLMATATEAQVAVASSYSKAVLRAVAGEMVAAHHGVDYFPSYEIIASPPSRGQFYRPGMRQVSAAGVAHVMRQFLSEHRPPVATPEAGTSPAPAPRLAPRLPPGAAAEDADEAVKCDEEILATFGPKPAG